ncbi:MAG: YkgJ family cysteine cluster protein [Deltaproteobacteria bacterium]|nr:YkgJ family cysteine cluster protein [Deltaproteobacteria bacterium]
MLFPPLRKKKFHGILLDAPRDGDDRCRSCGGICCSSFTAVEISWDEYERLQGLGARRLQLSLFGAHKLEIDCGCEFLSDGRCSIYEARPDICRRFYCSDT